MVYEVQIFTDGGCRGNGYNNAIGASAAVFTYPNRQTETWTRFLPSSHRPPPTSQRAELTGIILALEHALEEYHSFRSNPGRLEIMIFTDSAYAIGCMTNWAYTWESNGWRTSRGEPVVNRDLVEDARELERITRRFGRVRFQWIPREQNGMADQACNDRMDSGR